ncbi:Protein of unknown function [Gryllus bimaculatus]|nr:Protein of unknown function [Gryllus bimaculatus]
MNHQAVIGRLTAYLPPSIPHRCNRKDLGYYLPQIKRKEWKEESEEKVIDEDRSLRGKRVEEVREIPMPDRLFTAAWPMGRPQSAPAMAATAGDWVMEAAASDAGSASGAGSQGLKSPTVLTHGLVLRQSNSKIFKDAERVIRRTQRGQCCSREQCCCELDIITAQLRIELQSLRERLMRNFRHTMSIREIKNLHNFLPQKVGTESFKLHLLADLTWNDPSRNNLI